MYIFKDILLKRTSGRILKTSLRLDKIHGKENSDNNGKIIKYDCIMFIYLFNRGWDLCVTISPSIGNTVRN